MFPEILSKSVIGLLADQFDHDRDGAAIEIGVGTVNFYATEFARCGFFCIAVDPVAYGPFLKIAEEHHIVFEQACILDKEGEVTLYGSDHSDLSSVKKEWWGVDESRQTQVKSITLCGLLAKHNVNKITFLKIDTEGSEFEILSQLNNLNVTQLPLVLEFEYGGGAIKQTGRGGWSPQFFEGVIKSINLLKSLGYRQGIVLDSNDTDIALFDLTTLNAPETLFKDHYEYGNMLLFKEDIKNLPEFENRLLHTQASETAKLINHLKTENAALSQQYLKTRYWLRFCNKLKRVFKKG